MPAPRSRRQLIAIFSALSLLLGLWFVLGLDWKKAPASTTEPIPTAVSQTASGAPTTPVHVLKASPVSAVSPRLLAPISTDKLALVPAVKDRWSQAPVISEAITIDPVDRTFRHRVRIVRTGFKYPLLRIEETLRKDAQTGVDVLVKQTAMVADHVLVTATAGTDRIALVSAITRAGGKIRSAQPAAQLYLVETRDPFDLNSLQQTIEALKAASSVVAVVEPDFIVHATATPGDSYYPQLYGLNNTGQDGGVIDADIDAPEAWELTTGSRSIRVGVIDTGINYTHPDLAANIWTNPAEIAGNGIDDDHNGYVDDVRGWDFVNSDANPWDDDGHGTHCAGTIGALGDNDVGVVGVNWQVSLVPIKFLDSHGDGATSDAVAAITYATNLGLELTSNSWGGDAYSQILYDTIAQVNAANRLFVAAAGNDGRNNDVLPAYPASFNLPNIISVAATDRSDALASFSDYGASSVDLSAPGVGIYSTSNENIFFYVVDSGTSMAAPHVSGVAALVLAHNGPLTAAKLKSILLANVDPIPSMNGRSVTGGRLNAAAAVTGRNRTLHHFVFDPLPATLIRGVPVTVRLRAISADGLPAGGFNSPVTLGATGTTLAAPVVATGWIGGVWTGQITPAAFSASAQLTAPATGIAPAISSSVFSVITGPLAQFTWDPIPSSQLTDTPFAVTLRAADAGGNPVLYSGPATLFALVPRTLAPTSSSSTDSYPFASSYGRASRQQVIYPASEIGGIPRRLISLDLYVGTSHPAALFRNWTIRLKNSSKTSISNPVFDSKGWTTVHVSNAAPTSHGWHSFVFSTPFDYDGSSSLLVDFSFVNTATDSNYLSSSSSYHYPANRSITKSDSTALDPFAYTWGTLSSFAPTIRFKDLEAIPVRPSSASLVNGVWSGSMSSPHASNEIQLRAHDAAPEATGYSNTFSVSTPPRPAALPPLTENWEAGSPSAAWSLSGSDNNLPAITTAHQPHGDAKHLVIASSNYSLAMRKEATLTLDLAGRTGALLSFWAKGFNEVANAPSSNPFTGSANFDGVAISNDGVTWYEIQPLRAPALTNAWSQFTINLDAAIATHGIAYTSGFRIRFSRYGDKFPPDGGIALDDISITATPVNRPVLSLQSVLAESASQVSGTLSLATARSSPTVFSLISSAPAKLSLPPTLTLPAGETSVTFTATPINDELFDGHRVITVTASPPEGAGLFNGFTDVTITDDDASAMGLVITPAIFAENTNQSVTATLTLQTASAAAVTVFLNSSDPSAASVPETLLLSRGQTTATFTITPINNTQLNGNRTCTLSATLLGTTPATAQFTVTDDEAAVLKVDDYSLFEGATRTGYVQLTGSLLAPMSVSLTSANPAQLTVPPTVIIPAGATSVGFVMTAVEDTQIENIVDVGVTATAAGFTSATATISISDNDADRFAFNAIASSQIANRSFWITAQPLNKDGARIVNFNSSIPLKAMGSNGLLPITPANLSFSEGFAATYVSINAQDTAASLILDDGSGHTGTSNTFQLGVGAHTNFAVTLSPSTAPVVGRPVQATIIAQDAYGNTITSFASSAELSVGPASRVTGNQTSSTILPFITASSKVGRIQVIYSPQQIGPAGALKSLGLYLYAAQTGTQLQNWTIRLKHFSALRSIGWQSNDWTTVHGSTVTLPPGSSGWVDFPLPTAFNYDGVSNLMVDFSFDNTATNYNSTCSVRTSAESEIRLITSESMAYGAPSTWVGINPSPSHNYVTADLRIGRANSVTVTPGTTIPFLGGNWTGDVSLGSASNSPITLQARRNGIFGQSSPFVILEPLPDLDADGLPDAWETTHGFNPDSATADHGRLGDPDLDGIPNLLEYAMGLDPNSAEAQAPTTSTTATHPESGQSHLVYTYRRLIYPGALTYTVTTSTNLTTWSAPATAPEVLSTVANPDGLTETVTLRINPALGTGRVFVRLQVDAP
ncbi:S8 family peptidase [Rariglobus hedericola]|uniref:S8 family serine peptidase n=1 Tax=Rariglobus hedericola TaxID=2597822 RepID=A0A556QK96_9BACT|nr:S8 family peptidase [Rariglobus hedericola]TSJ77075.1 S8 family serine peptidase [Rariglobus hedericola]